ncbi:MAG TPA: hypothetical protein PK170_01535 [Anaerolineae bacterium]|nr:hypothetical protein [Anaerolineae bacterium]
MPPGDSPQTPVRPVETPLLSELQGYLEDTTAQTLRQVARQWGWPLKGTAKADLVDQMLNYLADATRMAEAIKTLSDEDLAVLCWLAALGNGNSSSRQVRGALLVGSGIRLAKKVIEASITSLIERGLLFYSEYRGIRLPDIYRQWLPRPNTSRLLVAAPDRVQPSACPTLAAVTRQTQLLLSAVTAERPLATVQSRTGAGSLSGRARKVDPRRPSLVAIDTLARWGFGTAAEQNQARFLLDLLVTAKVLRLSVQQDRTLLVPADPPDQAWEVATAIERLARLRQTYLIPPHVAANRMLSWSEMDMVFGQNEGDNLVAVGGYASSEQLVQQLQVVGIWLCGLLVHLQADAWVSFDQFCRLVYETQRNLLAASSALMGWSWTVQETTADPMQMPYETWMESYGRIVEAWLTGPASWLLLVQLSEAGGRPVAFRRPAMVEVGEAYQAPPGSLRFMADGAIGLTNDWRANELRRLLRFISVEAARDASTTLLRLDSSVFRSALQAGQDVASLGAAFAAAGFPLSPAVQETLQTWQDRAGRYQLYEQMTVLEFGEDVLPEELRAISRLTGAEYYQPAPRCLVFPDPQVMLGLVDELRRRGYTPQVLS